MKLSNPSGLDIQNNPKLLIESKVGIRLELKYGHEIPEEIKLF